MLSLQGNHVTHIPLEATAGKLKYVDTEGEIVQSAKLVGISFGGVNCSQEQFFVI